MAHKTQVEKLTAQYEKFTEKMASAITDYIVSIIQKDPHIKAISFIHNYESYWNDDGYSVLGLKEDPKTLLYIDDLGEESTLDIEEECYGWSREKGSYDNHPACPIIQEFIQFLSEVPEELVKMSYEEGEVYIYADGSVKVEEWSNY